MFIRVILHLQIYNKLYLKCFRLSLTTSMKDMSGDNCFLGRNKSTNIQYMSEHQLMVQQHECYVVFIRYKTYKFAFRSLTPFL